MQTLKTALAILWRIGLFFLLFGIVGAAFILPVASRLSAWEETFPVRSLLFSGAAAAASLLLATWLMTRFVDRRPFRTIGFSSDHLLRDTAAGLLVGVLWLAASLGILWAAGWAVLSQDSPVASSGPMLAGAALAVLLNVLAQQLLLCGYILQTIRKRSNFLIALAVSSALFSLYHGAAFQGQWLPAVNVFLAGALFCLAYGLTDNLWLPTAIHFSWNCLLGPVLGLTVSGSGELGSGERVLSVEGPASFTGGSFGLEGGLIVTLTTAALVVAFSLLRRNRLRRRTG